MYINRHMEEVLLSLSNQYPCILVTGPRQVGKTTMIKKVLEKKGKIMTYVTLDDLDIRQTAKSDPKLFFQLYKPPIVIDEIQYAPELFPYIKIIVDENQKAGEFILTGSQVYRLMKGISESLAGRIAILKMQGLSQSEMFGRENQPFIPELNILTKRNNPMLDMLNIYETIYSGLMPAIASGKYKESTKFYSGYVSTYLQKDIRDISEGIDELRFFNFITATACRTAQLLNIAEIARDSQIDQKTANRWLDILEMLGIIYYIYPYSNNLLKRTVKRQKMYFYDTGLVTYLTKWSNAETLMTGAFSGAILETFVMSEIMKSYYNAGKEPYVYYYRDVDMREIDIIIEKDGTLYPAEIKKAVSVNKNVARSFNIIAKSGLKQGTGGIINISSKLSAIDKDTLIIPIGLI